MNKFMEFFPLILMLVILYFLMIRPQMKRQKELRNMLEKLAVGDEIVTCGGLIGKITSLKNLYITVELSNNLEVKMQKSSVTVLLPKGTLKSIQK